MNSFIKSAVAKATKTLNKDLDPEIDNKLVDLIQTHGGLAIAAAWIPIGGLDVAALTTNVWTMYIRINKLLGISFQENMMKSIGSAVMANLASNIALTGVASALKFLPGVGTIVGAAAMSATVYGTTMGAAWIYLMAIINWFNKGQNKDNLEMCVNEVIAQNKEQIDDIIKDEKKNYRS